MAATPSTMLDLGTPAPPFSLPDVVSKRTVSLDSFASRKALLVMFICHHCPFVKHIKDELARLGQSFAERRMDRAVNLALKGAHVNEVASGK